MKTDAEIKREVEAELAWDPAVQDSAIGVAVKDGVVTLSGHVGIYPEKRAAEKALERVSGVRAAAIEIDVLLSPQHKRSDTDIAHNAEEALRWHALVPASAVRLTVKEGWITLKGELDWEYQRRSVEQALRHLTGVVGISNEIALRHKMMSSDDIGRRIGEALQRQTAREARHLKIDVRGDTVTLSGAVHSWHERNAICGAAWSAPGVRHVVDKLFVE